MPCALIVYDANGNTLSDAQGRSFTWDFENRLTQEVNPGVGTTTFRYDPWGRRIQKSGPLGTTNYLYDGMNLLEELDGSGNVLARYTRTENLDEPLSESRSGTTSYYQHDGLGSVTSLSDGAGALAKTYSFDSFGNLTASIGTLTSPFRYTGREFDSETGLFFNRARYFDPSGGRFLSEDPLGFLGSGSNFYRYVGNSPTNLIDPLGLTTCVVTPTLGTICYDWNTNWNWLQPQGPQPPPLPPDLRPNPPKPPKPPKPPRNCNCFLSLEYNVEIFRIHQKYEERELRKVKHMIWMSGGAEAGGYWLPWLERLHLPDAIYEEYEIWDIMREEDREIEELRERWGCR